MAQPPIYCIFLLPCPAVAVMFRPMTQPVRFRLELLLSRL